VSTGITLVLGIFAFGFALYTLIKIKQQGKFERNSSVVTLILCLITSTTFLLWRLAKLAVVVTPDRAGEELATDNGIKNRKNHPISLFVEKPLIGITIALAVGAILNISIVWIDTSARISKMKKGGRIRTFNTFRKITLAAEVLWVLACIIVFPIAASYLFFVGSLFLLIIAVSFLYGRSKIVGLLTSLKGSGESGYDTLIRQMNKTTVGVLFGAAVLLGGGGAYSIISIQDWRSACEEGKICSAMATNELISVGLIITLITCIWFLYQVSVGNASTKRSKSSSKLIKGATNDSLTMQNHTAVDAASFSNPSI